MGYVATTAGVGASDISHLMVTDVEPTSAYRPAAPLYRVADRQRQLLHSPSAAALQEASPHAADATNERMAKAFGRTHQRDYARASRKPDARSVLEQLPG